MENKDCKIVLDLLPNYIDGLTSNETNQFIEEHLKKCKKCQEAYKNMTYDLEEKNNKNNNEKDNKKINIFKKVNNKIKILKTIIIIIVLIFIMLFTRKLIIINNIEKLASKTNYKNYSKTTIETTEKYVSKTEYYQNNNNFVKTTIHINQDENSKNIMYKINGKEDLKMFSNGSEENISENLDIKMDENYQFLNKDLLGNVIISLIPGNLKIVKLNNIDCYLLNTDKDLNFIDKKTGLTIKEINIKNNSTIDYKYTFNDVTDEKIEK